ncbi:MAG: M28 family peptidase [Myxococcales bacterium]|nr:MAG: M28 family peptidase [Myxococcales bacterium]
MLHGGLERGPGPARARGGNVAVACSSFPARGASCWRSSVGRSCCWACSAARWPSWSRCRANRTAVRWAELPGHGALAGELVVVGAHYDSVETDAGCPGANDNATGTAAMLALAHRLRGRTLPRTVRFVGFVNEEPPYFWTDDMGSVRAAKLSRARGERIAAMLSLETLGSYSDLPGSQRYPFPFSLFYPTTADFVAFVGNVSSRAITRQAVGAFRRHARFPSEGAAPASVVGGVGLSDHWSYWQQDYPAVMVTDTAFFRYPWYHTPRDVPAAIDHERLARVVDGLTRVVEELAGGERGEGR